MDEYDKALQTQNVTPELANVLPENQKINVNC